MQNSFPGHGILVLGLQRRQADLWSGIVFSSGVSPPGSRFPAGTLPLQGR